MKIIIDCQKIHAKHGVLPQENAVGAYFYVSTEVEMENTRSIETDELGDTISYADLAEIVEQEMAISSKLLEHVAGRIGERILRNHSQVQSVKVRIIKENPPMGIECKGAGIEITFRR